MVYICFWNNLFGIWDGVFGIWDSVNLVTWDGVRHGGRFLFFGPKNSLRARQLDKGAR